MTNEEKALELFPDMRTLECFCKDARGKLIEMAEWKDKQFEQQKKEFLDKACEWLSQELIYPTSKDEVEWAKLEIEKFRKYMKNEKESF